jgi:uncharacterized protein (DUF1697 family)
VTNYVALLRGVNLVGKSTLKMADLKAIAGELGFARVRTVVASGNLLFASKSSEQSVRKVLEQRLKQHMAKDVRVIVRTESEMDAVVRANPFPDLRPNLVQAFFLDEPPPANLFDTVRNKDDERIGTGAREVYVAYGEKGIGRSRLRIPAAEAGTARNMNTVAKLAELLREMS